MVPGEVRKKKAMVMWKRERDVMIVAAEMRAMVECGLSSARSCQFVDLIRARGRAERSC